MSKKNDITLLLPSHSGWELWKGSAEQGFQQTLADGPQLASEIDKFPSGNLTMGFPTREALAVPFKAQTDDPEMFEDLAEMHLEKSGIRPEIGAGRLTDVFPAGSEEGQVTLLNVVLSAPRDGSMPHRSPDQFDISARFFQMEPCAVTLWQELGRWVFAITRDGHLLYFQSLAGDDLETDAVREIRLALTQLGIQGMAVQPDRAIIWTSGQDSDPSNEVVQSFAKSLGAEVITTPKPQPILPDPISKLVPADVRAEQRLKASRQQRNLLIAAALLVYLGLAAYFGWQYYQLNTKHNKQKKELANLETEALGANVFIDDWKELAPVVDSAHWPLNNLHDVVKVVPTDQTTIRIKTFTSDGVRILVKGEANTFEAAGVFGGQLKRRIKDYKWSIPAATEAKGKTIGYKFEYEGILKAGSESSQ